MYDWRAGSFGDLLISPSSEGGAATRFAGGAGVFVAPPSRRESGGASCPPISSNTGVSIHLRLCPCPCAASAG